MQFVFLYLITGLSYPVYLFRLLVIFSANSFFSVHHLLLQIFFRKARFTFKFSKKAVLTQGGRLKEGWCLYQTHCVICLFNDYLHNNREFWTSSINAASWWKIIQTYTHSVAVMSIIGYIIGLGDRHLDNILVDLTSGEVMK